jgi:hypothetical protein
MLREPQALNQFADQQRLFDRRKATALSARHHTEHARGQITRPTLDAHGVATDPAQRGDAPIAVNQNQTLATLHNFDWRIGHCNTGDNLAAALDRTRDPLDRARLSHAGAGEAQIQAVEVEIQALSVHGPKA